MMDVLNVDRRAPRRRCHAGAREDESPSPEVLPMVRRLPLILTLVGLLLAMAATPALANIHPIQSSECAAADASEVANTQNPPGQFGGEDAAYEEAFFAGEVPATGSFLRAVIATGVIIVDED